MEVLWAVTQRNLMQLITSSDKRDAEPEMPVLRHSLAAIRK
jgi:hypothetical protein